MKKTISLEKWDKVEVNWIDSVQNTSGWCTVDDFEWKAHYEALYHVLIGYYIGCNGYAYTFCQCHSKDKHESFINAFSIPKGCVLGIKKLK